MRMIPPNRVNSRVKRMEVTDGMESALILMRGLGDVEISDRSQGAIDLAWDLGTLSPDPKAGFYPKFQSSKVVFLY